MASSFAEPDSAVEKTTPPDAASVTLCGSVASVDCRYERDGFPDLSTERKWTATAWRGERVHGQFVLWTGTGLWDVTLSVSDLKSNNGGVIPSSCLIPRYVRYTLAEGRLVGDILEPAKPLDIPAGTTRPIWLSVNIPGDAVPGAYTGTLRVEDARHSVEFSLSLEVLQAVLPPPKNWSFHLDLWQNPWAIARVHGLEPWSDAHWSKLEEVLTFAAEAGQKCLTTTIVHRPWGGQTFDPFGSMVDSIRGSDGSWRYDYALFDKVVECGMKCGITRQINCYSMVPWGNNLYYHDEATGEQRTITAKPGTSEYEDYWRPFLKDFSEHLKEKGWLEITAIAMDERDLEDMEKMIALVKSAAPDLKIALAANQNLTNLMDSVHDYCFAIGNYDPDPDRNLRRAMEGRQTTFYVCCGPDKPNTFTFSPPAESTWMGWYAASQRLTGFLRWALCSYTEDPFRTTDYPARDWPSGDCYLIYPGPRSSIRFERLREGIQDYEKIRVLREHAESQGESGQECLNALDDILGQIVDSDHTAVVNKAKASLEGLTRLGVQ